jgi:acyl-CoA thioesterase-2
VNDTFGPDRSDSSSLDQTRSAADFLGLIANEDPLTWRLPVSLDVCGATGTLHGGCALAAVTAAAELATGRPLAAASSQYLARAELGAEINISLDLLAQGKAMTQLAFRVTEQERVILQGHASLGGRDLGIDQQWAEMPDAPAPDVCPPRPKSSITEHSFTDLADLRVAHREPGDARMTYWARFDDDLGASTPILTALADLLPSGMRVGLDKGFRGSSLDNSIRIASNEPTEWVLIDLHTSAFRHSIGHGIARLYNERGTLLASGTQSFAVTRITGPLDR